MNTNVIRVNFGQNSINAIPTMKPEIVKPEIIIPSGIESTFANIGTDVSKAKSLDEALYISGLDYDVISTDKYAYINDKKIKLPTKAVMRSTDYHFYADVSETYSVAQNKDIFQILEPIFDDITIRKMGETQSGMVYALASLETMSILGDIYEPYLCIQSSHNGRYSLAATICPLRIVCQNQFNIAFRESPNTIKARHTDKSIAKFDEKLDILLAVSYYMKELNKQAEKWATQKVSNAQIVQILDELFPMDKEMKDYQLERVEEQKILLTKAYQADDNANFRNTMWGMINAYSDFITHKPQYRTTDTATENNFVAVTFDPKAMMNFINLLSRVAA